MGATQFLAASAKPPHLLVLFPYLTGASHYDVWVYTGGAFNLVTRFAWTLRMVIDTAARNGTVVPDSFLALSQALAQLRAMNGSTSQTEIESKEREIRSLLLAIMQILPLNDIPIPREAGGYFFDWLEHWRDDEYWQKTNTRLFYDQIELPMIHIGGWYDEFTSSTLENYCGFAQRTMDNHAPVHEVKKRQKLIMGPWVHGTFSRKVGEVDFGEELEHCFEDICAMHIRHFDYWLKGIETGIADEPPVRLFVMGTNRWRDEQEWPLARTDYQKWYLHSNGAANSSLGFGSLSLDLPGHEPTDKYLYDPANPVPTNGGNILRIGLNLGPCDQRRTEARDDILLYTSEPLESDLEVTGPLKVMLWASSDAEDTDFTAKLIDVYPDGKEINIQDGILRASFRESAVHPSPIEPGTIYPLEIDLWATSNVFLVGHRLKLEISSSNFPRYNRNLNAFGPPGEQWEIRTAQQVIYHSCEYPSHIVLPVIPNNETS
jgi:putative CocE/NonD family hydrolase